MSVPYIFATSTSNLPLAQLDANFSYFTDAITVSGGNVGIGTSSPSSRLHVVSSGNPTLTVSGTDGAYSSILKLYAAGAGSSAIYATGGSNQLIINTNNIDRMLIDSSGNVGIGVTPGTNSRRLIVYGSTATNASTSLALQTSTSGTGVSDGFTLELSGTMAYLWNYENDAILIGTNNSERIRIDSSGNLLIGYTSSNGAYKLQVNSQIFATSSTIATSDVKYKENVNTLENALDLVCSLNPVSFDWKQHPVHNFDRSTTTTGFIAQEVQAALQNTAYVNAIVKTNTCVLEPEEKDADGNVTKPAVTEEFLGIAEGNLIAVLTAAIQELKAELDSVKSQLAALQGN